MSNINGPFEDHGFDAYGYNNRMLLLEDKNILIIKGTNKIIIFKHFRKL